MRHAGPPLSKLTLQLSRLAVGESVVVDSSFYKSIGQRGERLGYRLSIRRIPAGRNAGKIEVFRLPDKGVAA